MNTLRTRTQLSWTIPLSAIIWPNVSGNGWGILDHGVGCLEKVHVVNGRTVDVDMGQETAYVYMAGKRYRLRGDVLTEED